MRTALLFVSLAAMTVSGCNSTTEPVVTGQWGSSDVALTLSPSGGAVTFACAEGTVNAGWTLADDGTWNANGRYATTAGPVSTEGRPTRPVHYTGTVAQNRLEFRVIFTDTNESVGPFALVRGKTGPANRCL